MRDQRAATVDCSTNDMRNVLSQSEGEFESY